MSLNSGSQFISVASIQGRLRR